jgi:hypothetical protein
MKLKTFDNQIIPEIFLIPLIIADSGKIDCISESKDMECLGTAAFLSMGHYHSVVAWDS